MTFLILFVHHTNGVPVAQEVNYLALQIYTLEEPERDPVDMPEEDKVFMALEHQHRSLRVAGADEFECLHPRWRDEILSVAQKLERSGYWRNDKNHLDYCALGAAFKEVDDGVRVYVAYRPHQHGAQRRRQYCLPAFGDKGFFKLFRLVD